MKKAYFLVWMCLLGLTGCSDFLEERIRTQLLVVI